MAINNTKPIVLHLGDPIKYNTDLYAKLESSFTVIRPSLEERQRPAFLAALRSRKWGDFSAVLRPWWGTGGEMGRWDAEELIPLLPPTMRVFASAGAGYDWADTPALAARGITYCNGRGASSEAVADSALWHIIGTFRNMAWSSAAARASDPDVFVGAHLGAQWTSRNPAGHTLGVVGLGSIGTRIAAKARAGLGMEVVYHDVAPKTPAEELAAGGPRRCASLRELLGVADCTVLAVPSGGGYLLGREEILAMTKKGARLVNVARGSLVDEEAVADALESGQLFAVGMDVFENEPEPNPRLVRHRQAMLTCHTAGGTLDTAIGFEGLAMQNVLAVLRGQAPLTPVNQHLTKSKL